MSAAHTPTPWRAVENSSYWQIDSEDGWQVGDVCASQFHRGGDAGPANAEFIVRSVNAHDDLVAALKTVAYQHALFVRPGDDIADATKEVVRAALAKAEGRS